MPGQVAASESCFKDFCEAQPVLTALRQLKSAPTVVRSPIATEVYLFSANKAFYTLILKINLNIFHV